MPKDDSWEKIREKRDEEDSKDSAIKKARQSGSPWVSHAEGARQKDEALSEKFDELILRVEPLLEQVNSLYKQYINGSERSPPIERRRYLDQIMHTLGIMHKATLLEQFRFRAVQARYNTYCKRWEKLLKDFEVSGKRLFNSRRK